MIRNYGNFQANKIFVDKYLQGNQKILEIGCGLGSLTNYLFRKRCDIRGIDINSDFVQKGKEIYGNDLPISISRAENLPYLDDSFDIVLSFDVLEHLFDIDKHLQETKRVLKGGGYYLLSTPNKWTDIPFEVITTRSFTKYKASHCSLHNYWEINKIFKNNGFSIEFIDIPVVNEFFKEKIKRTLGNMGLFLVKIINPDKLPIFLKTNFYIKAKKI